MFHSKSIIRFVLSMCMASVVMMTTGCDDGDSGGDPIGTVAVQGNISDFEAETAPVATGVIAGVTVKIKGTSYSTTTADDGTFVISGIAAGNHILVIVYGDMEIEYPLGDLPENTRVEITNISIRINGDVVVEKLDLINLVTNTTTTRIDDEEESNIAGNWKFQPNGLLISIGAVEYQMVLEQNGRSLSGTLMNSYFSGSIEGATFNLTRTQEIMVSAAPTIQTLNGTVNEDGTMMSGTWSRVGGSGTWSAVPGIVPAP